MHNMEELDVQHDHNYNHINVKVMCLNGFDQLSFLRFINNIIFFIFYIWLKGLVTLFVTRWNWKFLFENLFLLFFVNYFWGNTFTLCIVQKSNEEEVIADVIISSETCYNSMGKRGHSVDDISLEIGNNIDGNDVCNDWMEMFCEYNIDD